MAAASILSSDDPLPRPTAVTIEDVAVLEAGRSARLEP